MKKLFLTALASLLVLTAVQAPASAADRVTKVVRTCKYAVTTAANAGADAVLTQANGQAYCDVSDIIVSRVVLEHNVTALTGTNVIFKVITSSDPGNITGSTTDPALDGSDGTTDLVSATITATGRGAKGTGMSLTGASGVTSNLGTKIGVWADVTSLTVLDGYVYLTIFGSQ